MRLEELDFDLPGAQIAQVPPADREDARLLVLDRHGGLVHAGVRDLPEHLPAGALLVVNDTRVQRARLRGRRATGGAVEILLIRRLADGTWTALGRASKALRPGTRVAIAADLDVVVEGRRTDGLLRVRLCPAAGTEAEAIDRHGEVPLPPYIRRPPAPEDAERYQTVFARVPGAVAAPTAGLHLTEPLMDRLRERGVEIRSITLHVGPGTFAPVTTERLEDHAMHEEHYDVPVETARALDAARARGRPVVAVGTTVVRTLESAVGPGGEIRPGAGETRLLLAPCSPFRVVGSLLTNFHVPRSTLLALVMAFAGKERILAAYAEAIRRGYRFFSYGDAMLIR